MVLSLKPTDMMRDVSCHMLGLVGCSARHVGGMSDITIGTLLGLVLKTLQLQPYSG